MGLLEEAAEAARVLSEREAELEARSGVWALEEDEEHKALLRSQRIRRAQRRFGVDSISLEVVGKQPVSVVDDLVVFEDTASSRVSLPSGGSRDITVHRCYVLAATKGNPFRPDSGSTDLQVSGFLVRDRSDLPDLLLENPDAVFDSSAVLGLLADGRRIRTPSRPFS